MENQTPQETKSTPAAKKTNMQVFLLGLIGAIALIAILFYSVSLKQVQKLSQDSWVITAADIFDIPAAKINGEKIAYTKYLSDIAALQKFYQSQPEGFGAISEEQTSDQVLVRLIANTLLEEVAEEFDVTVDDAAVQAQQQELLSQFPTEDEARENIKNLYGWELEEFTENIIYPIALEKATSEAFEQSDIEGVAGEEQVRARHILLQPEEGEEDEALQTRTQALLDRITAGEEFATLAAEFGTDGTKDTGGDLGFFGKGVMVPEFEQAALALNPGDAPTIVKTQFGYHIVEVTEKKQIKNFESYMESQLKQANIEILIPVNNPFTDLQIGN